MVDKIFQSKETGVKIISESKPDDVISFQIEGVYLKINYALTPEELKRGIVPAQRLVNVAVSDDLALKILEIYQDAKEVDPKDINVAAASDIKEVKLK